MHCIAWHCWVFLSSGVQLARRLQACAYVLHIESGPSLRSALFPGPNLLQTHLPNMCVFVPLCRRSHEWIRDTARRQPRAVGGSAQQGQAHMAWQAGPHCGWGAGGLRLFLLACFLVLAFADIVAGGQVGCMRLLLRRECPF